MLTNIELVENLDKIARDKSREYVTDKIKPVLLEEALSHGWLIDKQYKQSVQIKKKKSYEIDVQDRIWSLLYKMDFLYMNGNESAQLIPEGKVALNQKVLINIVGIDHEVGVGVFCKASSERRDADAQFRQEIERYNYARSLFSSDINHMAKDPDHSYKRKAALVIFNCNINLSEDDKKFAKEKSIILFDENDLEYYEELVSHLGAAAKYQFLADLLPGAEIPALDITVPAIRMKMGKFICYSFAIVPEHLLKISYVAHRARGKKADLQAYQRMIEKKRLDDIRRYIDRPGIFPTNIVINLDKKPDFDPGKQVNQHKYGTFGWLKPRSAYKSAWIIDGQHRLYAFSGHPRASSSLLSVLAFETLSPDLQAELFIDINSKQKSVKESLLQELFGDLHKDAPDAESRVKALISQTIKFLDTDRTSPFYQRIQSEEEKRSKKRCISWQNLFRCLSIDIFIGGEKGILWVDDDDEATKERIISIVKEWFDDIKKYVSAWWDVGSGEGGGLAMNDSVASCFNILRNVLQHLAAKEKDLRSLSNQNLCDRISPYALAISKYLSSLNKEERQTFRDKIGGQGRTQRTRMLLIALNNEFPEFMPSTLKDLIEEQAKSVKSLLIDIKIVLKKFVIEALRVEFGVEEQQWWIDGVPETTKRIVSQKYEEDRGKQGNKENYFDFLDYKKVIQQNWSTFHKALGNGDLNSNIEHRISWIDKINDIQELLIQEKTIAPQKIAELEMYDQWLHDRTNQTNGI